MPCAPQHAENTATWIHGLFSGLLAAGTDLRVVQDMLGHTSYAFTADTYTAVLPEVAYQAAEATARVLYRRRLRVSDLGCE